MTFHLCEEDWNQLKSRGLIWFSCIEWTTIAALPSKKLPLEVIECNEIFLGDERVTNEGRVDPVQTFGLFSGQCFNIVELGNVKGHTLKVHVKLLSLIHI